MNVCMARLLPGMHTPCTCSQQATLDLFKHHSTSHPVLQTSVTLRRKAEQPMQLLVYSCLNCTGGFDTHWLRGVGVTSCSSFYSCLNCCRAMCTALHMSIKFLDSPGRNSGCLCLAQLQGSVKCNASEYRVPFLPGRRTGCLCCAQLQGYVKSNAYSSRVA